MVADPSDHRDVIARRLEFVAALSDGPCQRPELVEELDHSRSTVDRAIAELESAGYVERVTGGYAATGTGRLAAREHRAHLARQESIRSAHPVLAALPDDWTPPPELLADARVETADPVPDLLGLLADEVTSADRVRVVLPAVPDSRRSRRRCSLVLADDLDAIARAPRDVLVDAVREFSHIWRGIPDGSGSEGPRSGESLVSLVVVEGDDVESSVAVVTVAGGEVGGFVHTRRPAAVEWARDHADRAAETADEVGTDLWAGRAALLCGQVAAETGAPEDARAHLREARGTFAAVGTPRDELAALAALIECCRRAGDEARAAEWRERAESLAETAPSTAVDRHAALFDIAGPGSGVD